MHATQVLHVLGVEARDMRGMMESLDLDVWEGDNTYLINHPLVQPWVKARAKSLEMVTAPAMRRVVRHMPSLAKSSDDFLYEHKEACKVRVAP